MGQGVRLINRLPAALTRAASKIGSKGMRLHDSIEPKDYPAMAGHSREHPLAT
ncbi:hypothetical protein ACFQYP_04250 [Nonomuraea antimicrobica]